MSSSIKINTVFKTTLSFLNILFPMLVSPYVARILSVESFTEYNRITNMISWFTPFAVFGVYTYGLRTISQIKKDIDKVRVVFSQLFIVSAAASILTTVVYFVLIGIKIDGIYKSLYLFGALQILSVCFAIDWVNEAFEDYGFIFIKSFIFRLLYVVLIFLFVKSENHLPRFFIISTLITVCNNLFTFLYCSKLTSFVKIKLSDLKKIIKPIFVIFLLVNASMFYTIFDRFILTWFAPKIELTYYVLSQAITSAVLQVTSSIIFVSIPRLSSYWKAKEYDNYYKLQNKTSTAFLLLNIPCCVGMAVLSSEIMYIYAGEKYIHAAFPLFLFCIRYFISAFDTIMSKQILLATENETVLTKIYYFGGLCNIALKTVLIFTSNLTSSACIITTLIVDIIVIIMQLVIIKKKKITYKMIDKNIVLYTCIALLFIPLYYAVRRFFPGGSLSQILLRVFISILICTAVYFLSLFKKSQSVLNLIRRKDP